MRTVFEVVRAVIFLIVLVLSFIPTLFIMAAVSVGAWFEDGLRFIGLPPRKDWLPLAAGILGYAGLGIAVPIYIGGALIGWPGAVIAPMLVLVGIAVIGRW